MTNITIRIDDQLAREAKVLAAQRGLSLSKLVSSELEKLIRSNQAYGHAKDQAIKAIREAGPLGYQPVDRSELHER